MVELPQSFTAVVEILGEGNPFPVAVMVIHQQLPLSLMKQADQVGMVPVCDLLHQLPVAGGENIGDAAAMAG
ncbi:hypothetical protein D3C75_829650 [compost metagenome]